MGCTSYNSMEQGGVSKLPPGFSKCEDTKKVSPFGKCKKTKKFSYDYPKASPFANYVAQQQQSAKKAGTEKSAQKKGKKWEDMV